MNLELLEKKIKESGVTKTFIAKELDMTYNSLLNKLAGKTEFTVREVGRLKKILHIEDYLLMDILGW